MNRNIHDLNFFRGFGGLNRVILILIVFGLIGTAGCRHSATDQFPGIVEFKTLELSAPISEVIMDIPVKEGERVEARQVIVQLDTNVAEAELLAQQSALAAAEAFFTEAEGDFKRQLNLRQARVSSPKALDTARRYRDEAVAQVNEKKARILQVQKRLEDLTIRSHSAGVIDQIPFEVGERTPAGGVVAVIIADDKPWIRLWLPARIISRIKLHLEVEIKVEGINKWYPGRLTYISREPEFTPHYALTERESGHLVYESRVTFEESPAELRPGIPAQARLRLPEIK